MVPDVMGIHQPTRYIEHLECRAEWINNTTGKIPERHDILHEDSKSSFGKDLELKIKPVILYYNSVSGSHANDMSYLDFTRRCK